MGLCLLRRDLVHRNNQVDKALALYRHMGGEQLCRLVALSGQNSRYNAFMLGDRGHQAVAHTQLQSPKRRKTLGEGNGLFQNEGIAACSVNGAVKSFVFKIISVSIAALGSLLAGLQCLGEEELVFPPQPPRGQTPADRLNLSHQFKHMAEPDRIRRADN
eukprot:gene7652-7715_t